MAGRYYISRLAGTVEGPFEADALRAMLAAGEVNSDTPTCPEGEQAWRPLIACPELATAMAETARRVRVSLVGPILVTVFCCLIGGIVSIVYAAQANTAAAGGKVTAALAARQKARIWMWASFGVGLLVNSAYLAAVIAGTI